MDIKRSDLPLLISLDALLDELNVTRAAKRLSISQSALSGQLARLRDIFDDRLLVPSENGRGMVPTQRAIDLRPRLRDALAHLRDAVYSVSIFDPAIAKRSFVVAAHDSVFTMVGLGALEAVVAQHNPDLRIAVIPATDTQLIEKMESGEIDLYLGDIAKVPGSLKVRFLLSDHFQMAQRIGHPRGNSVVTLDEYCTLPHVMVSQRAEFHSPVDDVLATLSKSRNVVVTVPNYNQVAVALAHSECVATLPSQLLKHYAQIIDILDLPFDIPPFNLAMAWHARAQLDDGHCWLRKCFTDAVSSA